MQYTQNSSTTDTIIIPYSYQCEKCGQLVSRQRPMPGGVGVAIMSADAAQRRALEDVRKRLGAFKMAADRGDYAWLVAPACPHCGYIQSWQVQGHRSDARSTTTLGIIFILLMDGLCLTLYLVTPEHTTAFWVAVGVAVVGTAAFIGYTQKKKSELSQTPRVGTTSKPTIEWPVV
jgi:predicted RNA-binding Zn-ribbon protein involved in translation (DUF1610 family)